MPPHVARLEWGKGGGVVEQRVEVASGACCSGGRGMEVGKEQQAGSRRKQMALYQSSCGHYCLLSTKRWWRFTSPTTDNWKSAPAMVSVNTEAVFI